ncbi:MAG TPA: phosphodiester glycosidase family protein, partial [Ktedonobacteraceae bacterium]|nr:phosphodiester glycosidase family protein [Ktedonobacteraceae bacterium]
MQPVERTPPRRQFVRFPLPSSSNSFLSDSEVPIESSRKIGDQSTLVLPAPEKVAHAPSTLPLVTVLPIQSEGKPKAHRKKRVPRWFAVCSIIAVLAVIFLSQGNGATGAWMADTLRAIIGPTATAQIESWYLGLNNMASQWQYQLSDKKVTAPWNGAVSTPLPTPPPKATLAPMLLTPMKPLISPALPGEGRWATLSQAPAPYNYLPLDARAFIRPDPAHPYAIVTLLQFDTRFTLLHIVGGTVEPGGRRGIHGPGRIPAADLQNNTLLAAFNGGFKYADGQYGLMTNGTVYVPPQRGSATVAVTKEGKIALGAWGVDPLLNSRNKDLLAWRQNAALLIDRGVINPLTHDGAAWGGTILNSAYTWRSAIGIMADGSLVYAAGNALTAETLGKALKAAGAVMAMQTDINPFWVRAFLYNR